MTLESFQFPELRKITYKRIKNAIENLAETATIYPAEVSGSHFYYFLLSKAYCTCDSGTLKALQMRKWKFYEGWVKACRKIVQIFSKSGSVWHKNFSEYVPLRNLKLGKIENKNVKKATGKLIKLSFKYATEVHRSHFDYSQSNKVYWICETTESLKLQKCTSESLMKAGCKLR